MKLFPLLLVLVLSLFSCYNEHQDHQQQKIDVNTNSVSLNNGKKWKANEATTTGINNMLEIIDQYENSRIEHQTAISDSLSLEFKTIFQKCTMKGEAHNQLHNYLLPIHKQLENLNKGDSQDEFNSRLKAIKIQLSTYNNFFE